MFKNLAPRAKAGGVQRARKLRRKMTLPEVLLWQQFRVRPYGLKFRRLHETGEYVLDFYCNDARLAIEADGMVHERLEQALHDSRRDEWLAGHGIQTLRVPASDVLEDAVETAEAIVEFVRARLPLHHPAAPGGPPPRGKLGED